MKRNFKILYDQGVPPYEIAERWGVPPKQVVDALGLPPLKARRQAAVKKVIELYLQGVPKREIAATMGRTIQNVQCIISKYKKRTGDIK